jgi:hypothetical protein
MHGAGQGFEIAVVVVVVLRAHIGPPKDWAVVRAGDLRGAAGGENAGFLADFEGIYFIFRWEGGAREEDGWC